MFGTHFYHEKIRKTVATFGTLFNNIYVIRKNSSGNVISTVKVPLAYAPKRKFLDRIRENESLDEDTKVAIKLPRMSFEIIDIAYDPGRQLQKTGYVNRKGTTNNTRSKFYNYVPYNISFQLNIYAKSQDDALQIVEQILPTFKPTYTLTMIPFSDYPDVKEDIPVTIESVTFADDYEGTLEQRRTIIYTLSFTMKINVYGSLGEGDIIRTSNVDIYNKEAGLADSDLKVERITVTPNPIDVSPDSDYGFNTTIDLTFDDSA